MASRRRRSRSDRALVVLSLLATAVPADRLQKRVVEAFQTGSVATRDYLRFNTSIGWHQHNDCMILQMISNDDQPLHRVLGPVVYYRDDFRGFCQTVHELVHGVVATGQLDHFRYTRYWHGHNAVTAIMLSTWTLDAVRVILKTGTYLSVLLLAIVCWKSDARLRVFGMVVAVFGALFWGLPYFAQSPSHGPGDCAVMLGLAALLITARGRISAGHFRAYCAAFGAILVYMEFLTGLLPTAAALLLPLGYFAAAGMDTDHGSGRHRWKFALHGLVGFALGALLTAAIKQSVALLTFGPDVITAFVGQHTLHTRSCAYGSSCGGLVAHRDQVVAEPAPRPG